MDWNGRGGRAGIDHRKEAQQTHPGALTFLQRIATLVLRSAAQLFIEAFQTITCGIGCQRAREEITRLREKHDLQSHNDTRSSLVKRLQHSSLWQFSTMRRETHLVKQHRIAAYRLVHL